MTNAKFSKKQALSLGDRGARRIKPNISKALDLHLGGLVRAERWLQENQAAIAYYNRRVAEQGLLSDEAGVQVRSHSK
jgi:post-segregation antitoxin (ccd killing protein)